MWVYYSRSTEIPPPCNVLPALKDLCIFYKWIVSSGERAGKQVAACSVEPCCYLVIIIITVAFVHFQSLAESVLKHFSDTHRKSERIQLRNPTE